MAGRPTKLCAELQVKMVEQLEMGNYIETACAMIGVSKKSVYEWLKRGAREKQRAESENTKYKKSEEMYVVFLNAVEKAQAKAEARDILVIAKASQDDWKASAWRLERRFPNRWGRKDRIEADITMDNKTEMTIEHRLANDKESVELLKQLYRRQDALD